MKRLNQEKKKEQEIKVLIREKKEELERLIFQFGSLQKIEIEQKLAIEKLSNNEDN